MSDAINDIDRESEKLRLSKLDPKQLASDLRKKAREVVELKNDLTQLGYIVEQHGENYKIFKEI